MRSQMHTLALLGLGVSLVALLVPTRFAGAVVPPQPAETWQGIRYVSGGVGVDERAALRAMDHDFTVQLIFATPQGDYLANVGVVMQDSTGYTVLDTVSQGPWFFVQLPAGTYTVTAQLKEQSAQQVVHVSPASLTDLVLTLQAT